MLVSIGLDSQVPSGIVLRDKREVGVLVFRWKRIPYSGEFGKSSVIRQTKTIQIFTYNYYLMAESIHSPNFSFAKRS